MDIFGEPSAGEKYKRDALDENLRRELGRVCS